MAIKKFFKFKLEPIKMRLSTSFLSRARCKFCSGKPSFYYYVWKSNSPPFESPADIQKRFEGLCKKKHFQRMCTDWHLKYSPRSFNTISKFSQLTFYKQFNPKMYNARGVSLSNYYTEYLSCDCGQTSWAFSDKASKDRPEIMQRKSRELSPLTFEDW